VSVKDRIFLALMTSLELCTERMSDFMGSDKLSSFCNYYVVVLLFRGRTRSRDNTSFWQQGPDFDIVRTCEWLSYVRASGSQAYDMLIRFFPCRVYIDSSHHDTLGYE
jgi:hypothetical protein